MFFCLALMGAPVIGCSDDDEDGGGNNGTTDSGTGGGTRNDAGADAGQSNPGLDGGNIDSGTSRDGGGSSDASAAALTEAQVVGVAAAINMGEIQAGTLAQTKAVSTQAKDYASMMVTMHTAAQARQTALGVTPAASPVQAEAASLAAGPSTVRQPSASVTSLTVTSSMITN
jgi:hypothetical protein